MTSTARRQRRYDHRLRELVHRTGDVTIATDVGVPRSTARDWLRVTPQVVVSLAVTTLSDQDLHHEVRRLRRQVQKLAALLRLVLAVRRVSGFTLSCERLPDGGNKQRILRAIEQARTCIPLRGLLRVLDLWVSNSLSGRHWQLNQTPAVRHPPHIVEVCPGHRAFAGDGSRPRRCWSP